MAQLLLVSAASDLVGLFPYFHFDLGLYSFLAYQNILFAGQTVQEFLVPCTIIVKRAKVEIERERRVTVFVNMLM